MQAATALPTVESSLEDFIARANATMVDVDQWDAEARAEKERQAKAVHDAEEARLRQVEGAVRGEAAQVQASLESRIGTLEAELSESQAQRAELEAKVAVLGSSQAMSTQVKELEGHAGLALFEQLGDRLLGDDEAGIRHQREGVQE